MATDYKDKIRKLLALAESPVEAEAKAALLKARTQDEISPSDYARGYMEGKEFDPTRRLAGEATV